MFEALTAVDPTGDESALIERIAELETIKSAARAASRAPAPWRSPDAGRPDVCGYGPIPAAVARSMVAGAAGDRRSRATLRRLYKHPRAGALVTMESRVRLFPRGLAAFIGRRDQRCRTPYCDAPIRHRDHARRWADGGPTTAENCLGLCERCNYVKENAGWRVSTLVDETHTHIALFTTPTGKTYRSMAPPRAPTIIMSKLEIRVGVALARHAA